MGVDFPEVRLDHVLYIYITLSPSLFCDRFTNFDGSAVEQLGDIEGSSYLLGAHTSSLGGNQPFLTYD